MSNVMALGEQEQRAVWRFWLDTLDVYPIDLVRDAFATFVRSGRRYVAPPDIVQIIEEQRREAAVKLARIKAQERQAAEDAETAWRQENRVKPERAQAILKQVGLRMVSHRDRQSEEENP